MSGNIVGNATRLCCGDRATIRDYQNPEGARPSLLGRFFGHTATLVADGMIFMGGAMMLAAPALDCAFQQHDFNRAHQNCTKEPQTNFTHGDLLQLECPEFVCKESPSFSTEPGTLSMVIGTGTLALGALLLATGATIRASFSTPSGHYERLTEHDPLATEVR